MVGAHLITNALLSNTSSQVRITSQDTLVHVVVIVGKQVSEERREQGS